MSKFQKRFLKNKKILNTALIVGQGFGYLEDIIDIYNTVFILYHEDIKIKNKKLIIRQSLSDISHIPKIDMIFLDLEDTSKLTALRPILSRDHSTITAEGRVPINGDETYPLVQFNYQCIEVNSIYHIWEKIK